MVGTALRWEKLSAAGIGLTIDAALRQLGSVKFRALSGGSVLWQCPFQVEHQQAKSPISAESKNTFLSKSFS